MIVFTIISIITAILAFYFQRKYFCDNMNRLEEAKNFFLPEKTYQLAIKEGIKSKLIESNVENHQLKKLIDELNVYIENNEGTTDFSVMQNKAERYSTSIFDNASSNLAFPTYIGLMGTFCGVFLGLIGFEWGDIMSFFHINMTTTEGSNVSRLVQGVIVSMVTSLVGLVLTTISNYKATEYKKEMDVRKNLFYDFIQNDLMPSLGTSVVAALNDLKETLGHFHESFDVITDHFEKTFNDCTSRFGEKFKENIDAISEATDKLGSSITAVNENVDRQKELLRELRSNGMMESLDKFVAAGKQFENVTATITSLTGVGAQLTISTQELVSSQQEYMSTLVVPKLIAERLNNILNRVTTFEESINALGTTLKTTEMIGNSEMNLINEHLEQIRKKNGYAQEYFESADDKLQELYADQTKVIGDLNQKYANAIAEHMDGFYDMLNRVSDEIDKKKKVFLAKLENAFDVAEIHSQFDELKHLPTIETEVQRLEGLVVDKDILIETIKQLIQQIASLEAASKEQSKNEADKVDNVNISIVRATENIIDLKTCVKNNGETTEGIKETLQNKYSELFDRLGQLQILLSSIENGKNALFEKIDGHKDEIINSVKTSQDAITTVIPEIIENKLKEIENNVKTIGSSTTALVEKADKVEHIDFGSIDKLQLKLNQQKTSLEEFGKNIERQKLDSIKMSTQIKSTFDKIKEDIEQLHNTLANFKAEIGKKQSKDSKRRYRPDNVDNDETDGTWV